MGLTESQAEAIDALKRHELHIMAGDARYCWIRGLPFMPNSFSYIIVPAYVRQLIIKANTDAK